MVSRSPRLRPDPNSKHYTEAQHADPVSLGACPPARHARRSRHARDRLRRLPLLLHLDPGHGKHHRQLLPRPILPPINAGYWRPALTLPKRRQ